MQHFTAHRLTFFTQAQDLVELNEHQGSALRGALFHALRHKFCAFARQPEAECQTCALAQTCPVATLVSTLDPQHARGQDRPRPFTIQPPIANGEGRMNSMAKGEWQMAKGSNGEGGRANEAGSIHHSDTQYSSFTGHYWEREDGSGVFRYEPGERLVFGLTLYAQAMQLFPYVVLALQEFETGGLGRKCEQYDGRWRRGRLAVSAVWAENPLTGEQQPVLRQGSRQVQVPDVPVTHGQMMRMASGEWRRANDSNGEWRMAGESSIHHALLTLHFLTPARLIEAGRLLKPETFRFRPFFQRLLERLEALSEAFCDTPLAVDFPALLAAAEAVQVVDKRLAWEELHSYSTRRHGESPISGLVGRVMLQAEDWTPFLPWLLWGQFTHVGKDAVKGNGLYQMEEPLWKPQL